MKLFAHEANVAGQTACEAGALVLSYFGKIRESATKSNPNDLLTQADIESDQLISARLLDAFPEHAVETEEQGLLGDPEAPYRWIVDPIDGTSNFSHGYPHFCISIALLERGEPVVATVYAPTTDDLFEAVRGYGATLNSEPIAVSDRLLLAQSLLSASFPHDIRERIEPEFGAMGRVYQRSHGVRRGGAAALDLAWLACGRIEGFWASHLQPWDMAAGALLVAEAGGRLSECSGERWNVRGNGICASNGRIHDELIAALEL